MHGGDHPSDGLELQLHAERLLELQRLVVIVRRVVLVVLVIIPVVEQLRLQLLELLRAVFVELVELLRAVLVQLQLVGLELKSEVTRRLILRNFQSPGDIVMLTAAVRDLHRCHPGEFITDVRTSCPDLWLHNPHLTPLDENDPGVEVFDCHYPLIHRSNQTPFHFLHGFIEDLNERLGLRVRPTEFRGDIHLSEEERAWFESVEAERGGCEPFWLLASGGKFDYTIKWWDHRRYQQVVDHFRGRIDFVQVGEAHHHQPPLRGTIDLRGQTTLRQLVRLVHYAQGCLSAVSLLMHLAAAVEVRPGMPKNRPCVVVAGGREPPHFTAYPHHQFIHTVGALRCCDDGGCWKSRTKPLGDGDEKDGDLCVDVVGDLPRCMDMITADEVARRIEMYFEGGAVSSAPVSASEAVSA